MAESGKEFEIIIERTKTLDSLTVISQPAGKYRKGRFRPYGKMNPGVYYWRVRGVVRQ